MEDNTKKCPFCNESIPLNATVCEYCGEQIEDNTINSDNKNKKLKKILKVITIVCFSIFFLTLILGIILDTDSNENTTQQNSSIQNENGISGSADFGGLDLCSRKKVGDILVRKLVDCNSSSYHSYAEKILLNTYKLNPNLKFKLSKPKVINSKWESTKCNCKFEVYNVDPSTVGDISNCKLSYFVTEKEGKYKVTTGDIDCTKELTLEEQGYE